METLVKMFYQKETGELNITCDDRVFDVSNIRDLSIERWGFPFSSNGVKWNGLYQELKTFVGNDNFTLLFDGDDTSFEILKYIFQDTPVNVNRQLQNAEVTLVYSENPFTTRIMINGEPFDTSRIQNRSIDEWLNPISIRGMQWDGIFNELNNYLGSNVYTISFVGSQNDMHILMNNCPSTVQIFYRDPEVIKLAYQSKNPQKTEQSDSSDRMADQGRTSSDDQKKSSEQTNESSQESSNQQTQANNNASANYNASANNNATSNDNNTNNTNYTNNTNNTNNTATATVNRRDMPLRRVREGKFFAGVCTGIAKKWEISLALVRILWVIFGCCILGIIVYIIMAISIPFEDEG